MLAYSYTVIIPDQTGTHLFLVKNGRGWQLPSWELHDTARPFWQSVDGVNRGLRERYSLAATTLRCLRVQYDVDREWTDYAYLVEPSLDGWAPSTAGRWFDISGLDRLPMLHPEHRELLNLWASTDWSGDGPPWYQPGWFTAVQAWIDEQLARLGLAASGPLEQLRSWERSSISRIPVGNEWLYFKAVPRFFAHEVKLLTALGAWLPAAVPQPLAADAQRHWVLMRDFGDVRLDYVQDLQRWEDALATYAALQVACVMRREQLLALGCPYSPLAALHEGFRALLRDESALLLGEAGGLTEDEVAALYALAPQIATACDDLAAFDIPMTIEHGDLWAGNVIAKANGSFAYFDWSDSAVTHPFFSLTRFLEEAVAAFPDEPRARMRLCDAYLRPWLSVVALDNARAAPERAQRLAPLHHALTYHQRILQAMHARWEMARMVPYYLRLLLRCWGDAVEP